MKKGKKLKGFRIIIRSPVTGKFEKHDGRKKQIIQIRETKSGKIKEVEGKFNRKQINRLRENINSYFYKSKTFFGKEVIEKKKIRKYKKLDIVFEKQYQLDFEKDKGYYRKTFTKNIQVSEFYDYVYSIFLEAKRSHCEFVVLTVHSIVSFPNDEVGYFFDFAEKYSVDIDVQNFDDLFEEKIEKINSRFEFFKTHSKASGILLELVAKIVKKGKFE